MGHCVCTALAWCAIGGEAFGQAADRSGTNPANFSRTLQLRGEYYSLAGGDLEAAKGLLLYSQPVGSRSKLDFEVPFVTATDAFGADLHGFGDVSASYKLRPYLSKSLALITGLKVTAPTASRDELGSNRWAMAPGVTAAFFFPRQRLIFAPTYQHTFSLSDSSAPASFDPAAGETSIGRAPVNRAATSDDIHSGTFDLYLVCMFKGGRRWLLVDPAITIDYEQDDEVSASIAPAFGFLLGDGHSVTTQTVIPVTGSGMDWAVKLTLKKVF